MSYQSAKIIQILITTKQLSAQSIKLWAKIQILS